MESSRRDLIIDMAVDKFIFKNNQITLCPCFNFILKTGVRLPTTWVSFYCEEPHKPHTDTIIRSLKN